MAGRKLAKKRNLLKQYNEGYAVEDLSLLQKGLMLQNIS